MLALATGLAMDAFAVSVSCGLAFDRREHWAAARIAFAFGAFQAIMPALGWFAGIGMRTLIEHFDHWIACGLLAAVGGKMIAEAWRGGEDGERGLTVPGPARLLMLAIATSLDALAVGLTLAVIEVPIATPAVVIGVVTFLISYLGIVLGHELENLMGPRLKRGIQVAGGLVLIAIGVRIVLEHTP